MWNKPWKYKEGLTIGLGLFFTGLFLQLLLGKVSWDLISYPFNLIVSIVYFSAIYGLHLLRNKLYFVRYLSTYHSAVSSLIWVCLATIIMGLNLQVPSHVLVAEPFGFSQMIASWTFLLLYTWMLTSLILATFRVGLPRKWHQFSFFLNHVGLIIALTAGVLGSADMQRLKMTCKIGSPEWRAEDEHHNLIELPLAIELNHFEIEEYPPKLMIIDNSTGRTLPAYMPAQLSLEDSLTKGRLLDWNIQVKQSIPMAASMVTKDTVKFLEFHSIGATFAAYVEATNVKTNDRVEGWVSCGSFAFPYKPMKLDSLTSLVMPERDHKKYSSDVLIYTKDKQKIEANIEVNKPVKVSGWKIYQLSYDESKGKWSEVSVFELVRDPWLPVVYVGVIMMLLGTFAMFINAQRKNKEE